MIENYYKILGIKKDATDEEVKKAYISLKNKYDPDSYEKESLKQHAREKTKEILEAFDAIMNERRVERIKKGENVKDGFVGGEGESKKDNSREVDLNYIDGLVSFGNFEEAERLLNSVEEIKRTARWYYLKGEILFKKGWLEEAVNFYMVAAKKDPENPVYKEALNKAMWQRKGNFGYPGNRGGYGGGPFSSPGQCNMCDFCTAMMCADLCCNCPGAGGGSMRYC